jgi:large subunit ribosomal protein L13
MKTFSLKANDVEASWHVVDADGQSLGRLAANVALLLRGKHRPTYTPHLDNGDFVIVVNAAKVQLTGNKAGQKTYYRHTGYPGGLRETILDKMMDKHPDRVVQKAVKGMLPHNRLSRKLLGHLKIYAGPEHPHAAQVNAGKGHEPVAAKESA